MSSADHDSCADTAHDSTWRIEAIEDGKVVPICGPCNKALEHLFVRHRFPAERRFPIYLRDVMRNLNDTSPCPICRLIWTSTALTVFAEQSSGNREIAVSLFEQFMEELVANGGSETLEVNVDSSYRWRLAEPELNKTGSNSPNLIKAKHSDLVYPRIILSPLIEGYFGNDGRRNGGKFRELVKRHFLSDWLRITPYAVEESLAKDLNCYRLPSVYNGSVETFQQIRQWLSNCEKHHYWTCIKDQGASCPTRLIEILDPINGKARFRLIETRGREKEIDGRYAALSYCWGKEPFLVTNSANLSSHYLGITVDDCPKTVQHAAEVAALLGLKYLWVDALCIIQGRDTLAFKDWERESLRMAQVYGDAYITIVASNAASAGEGFLRKQDRSDWAKIRLTQVSLEEDSQPSASRDLYLAPFGKHVDKEAVSARAWCTQESLLSRRIVDFLPSGVHWACRACSYSECESEPEEQAAVQDIEKERPMTTQFHAHMRLRKGGLWDFWEPSERILQRHNVWQGVLDNFCRRQISFESDRLPALSGFAQRYAKRYGDEYVVGLWKSTFWSDLLWACHSRRWEDRDYRIPGTPLPSWSWGSVSGAILPQDPFDGYYERQYPDLQLLSYDVKTSDETPFGHVSYGEITIRGEIMPSPRGLEDVPATTYELLAPVWDKSVEETRKEIEKNSARLPKQFEPGEFLFFVMQDRRGLAHGLVLRRSDKKLGAYERVMIFRSWPLFVDDDEERLQNITIV